MESCEYVNIEAWQTWCVGFRRGRKHSQGNGFRTLFPMHLAIGTGLAWETWRAALVAALAHRLSSSPTHRAAATLGSHRAIPGTLSRARDTRNYLFACSGWRCCRVAWRRPRSFARRGNRFKSAGQLKWVRTVDGWERPEGLVYGTGPAPPRLHPLVVAAGQVLLSALALVACSGAEPNRGASCLAAWQTSSSDASRYSEKSGPLPDFVARFGPASGTITISAHSSPAPSPSPQPPCA